MGRSRRAAVVLADGYTLGKEELDAFLAGRSARYKLPASVVVIEGLPMTVTGKVRKDELRAMFPG